MRKKRNARCDAQVVSLADQASATAMQFLIGTLALFAAALLAQAALT
jgi:hypothetical protein